MDNTDFILSKFSYIFSQPLSPLSQYLKLEEDASDAVNTVDINESGSEKKET
jgi:hypothetical protein